MNSGASWTQIGSSTITSPVNVVCAFTNTNIVLASVSGKLKLSTDGGSAWTDKNSNSALYHTSIEIAKANSALMFAGYEKDSLYYSMYRSYDIGYSWSHVTYFFGDVKTDVNAITTLSGNNQKVWAAGSHPIEGHNKTMNVFGPSDTTGGVFYSPDAGSHWCLLGLKNDTITAIGVYQFEEDIHLYAAKESVYSKLLHSTDGSSWTIVSLPVSNVHIYDIKTSGSNVYVATNKGLCIKPSGSSNFTKYDSGMYDDSINVVAVSPQSSARVYAGSYRSLYKTTNTGTDWADININIKKLGISSASVRGNLQMATTENYPAVWRNPNTVWQSVDASGTNDKNFDGEFMLLHSSNSQYAFAAGKMGDTAKFIRSTDSGKTWQSSYTGAASSAWNVCFFDAVVDPVATNKLYMVGNNGNAGSTSNFFANGNYGATNSWEEVIVNSTYRPTLLAIALDTSGATQQTEKYYVGSYGFGLYKTTNSGNYWAQWTLPNSPMNYDENRTVYDVALNIRVPSIVYASSDISLVSDSICLWKSENSGSNWNPVFTRSDTVTKILMHPSYPTSGDYLWVISSNGRKIFKTADACTTWTDVTGNLPTPIYDLRRNNSNDSIIYAATAKGLYRINPPPEAPKNARSNVEDPELINHPRITWDVSLESDLPTQKYKIYKKRDTGPWTYIGITSTNDFIDDNEYLDAPGEPTTVYYHVKTIDVAGNLSQPSNSVSFTVYENNEQKIHTGNLRELPKEFALEQNYPNPFNPTTTIKFALPVDANVTLKIVSILGKEINLISNEFKAAGYHEIVFDAKKLSSGVYIYKLTAGNFSATKKMMLMK